MEERVLITCVKNILDPFETAESKYLPVGQNLAHYINHFFPDGWKEDYDLVISENGEVIENPDLSVEITQRTNITFAIVPQGSGGAGKIVGAVLMVVGALTWAWGGGALAKIGLGMIVAGAAIMAYSVSMDIPDEASSITYSWTPGANSSTEGIAWPVLYGTHRIAPPVIGQYVEVNDDKQYINLLYGVADHKIDSIDESAVEINNTTINPTEMSDWNIDWETRLGDTDQSVIQYFNDTRSSQSVGITVGASYVTVTTDGNAVEGLGIALSMPYGLYYVDDEGDYSEHTVTVDIEYKLSTDASWTPYGTSETTTETVIQDIWCAGYWYSDSENTYFRKTSEGSTNPDDHIEGDVYTPTAEEQALATSYEGYTGSSWFSRLEWKWHWVEDGSTVVVSTTTTYNYTEITANQTDPVRKTYYIDRLPAGTYQVRVRNHDGVAPANSLHYANKVVLDYVEELVYDDFSYPGSALFALWAQATDKISSGMPSVTLKVTRSTVPVWTGSAYENLSATNPAWVCYDMLHNSNYGCGLSYDKIIYADFLAWATWCDTNEYTCNIYFDAIYNLRRALDAVSLLGRGHVIQRGSKYTVIYDDAKATPVQGFLFNQTNMIKDSFAEEWISYPDRANVIEMTYYDADDNYSKQTFQLYADDFETTTREVQTKSVNLIGCTDRDMAIKHAKYMLNVNRYVSLKASWKADIDALGCMPGDVIEFSHDVPQYGYSGRVISSTNNTVTLDWEKLLAADVQYYIVIRHIADDTREEHAIKIVTQDTTTATLTLASGAWTHNPALHDLYAFGTVNSVTKLARVASISKAQDLRRTVSVIEYNPDVYSDTAVIGTIVNQSSLTGVQNLQSAETFFSDGAGTGHMSIVLTWSGQAISWDIYYQRPNSMAWNLLGTTSDPYYVVTAYLTPGVEYVFSVTDTGVPGVYTTTCTYTGKPEVPEVPNSFTATLDGYFIDLAWTVADGITHNGHNIYLNNTLIASNIEGSEYVYKGTLVAGTYTFALKTLDPFNQESATSATVAIVVSVPATPSPSYTIAGETAVITWADCKTTLPIDHYIVTYNGGTDTVKTLRYSIRIDFTGARNVTVCAVDIAGNSSLVGNVDLIVPELSAVTGITATGKTYAIQLDITFVTFATFEAISIWSSTTNDRSTAVKIGETSSTVFIHSGLNLIDTRYYWMRIRDIYGNYSTWYPSSATGGRRGDTSSDPTDYLDALAGQISESQLTTDLNTRIDWIDAETTGLLDRMSLAETSINSGEAGTWSSITDKLAVATYNTDQYSNSYLRVAAIENQMRVLDTAGAAAWSSSTSYTPGAIVSYSSTYYRCIKSNSNEAPSSNPTYWTAISAGMMAEWTLKMDVNGHVAGVGLMLDETGSSTFEIVANKFAIVNPNSSSDSKYPFIVGNINGSSTVGISGDLIVDGSILARSIKASSITADRLSFTSLSGLNSTEGTKLSGIAAGADVTADNTAKAIINQGTLATKSSVDLSTTQVTNKSLANLDSTANTKLSGIAAGADVTLTAVDGGLTLTGGGLTLSNGGSIKGGQIAYGQGTGFFLGYQSGAYKFSIGGPAKSLSWDGSDLIIAGDVIATGNIKSNAVTQAIYVAAAAKTVNSGVFTSHAGKMLINVTWYAAGTSTQSVYIKRIYGTTTTTLWVSSGALGIFTGCFVDTPSSGLISYTAEASGSINRIDMQILEIQR